MTTRYPPLGLGARPSGDRQAERKAVSMVWILWWFLFVALFLMVPLGYGWGYRGWGPPYYRRPGRPVDDVEAEAIRRQTIVEQRAEAESWGWIALVFWILFAVAIVWLVLALIAAA